MKFTPPTINPKATPETDVVLQRVPMVYDKVSGERRPAEAYQLPAFDLHNQMMTMPVTNVPWTVVWHSPDGFEWGYGGSGPADLALNILNWFVPPGDDGCAPVECHKGSASRTAVALHQEFKREFIAGMAHEGGTIPGRVIAAWIDGNQPPIVDEYAIVEAGVVCANCGDGTGNGHCCEEPLLVDAPTKADQKAADRLMREDDEFGVFEHLREIREENS